MSDSYDLKEAADYLKCGPDTLRELIAADIVPYARIGRGFVFLN